jgi:hypothetical protein
LGGRADAAEVILVARPQEASHSAAPQALPAVGGGGIRTALPASGYFTFLQYQDEEGDFNSIIIDNNSWTVNNVNHSFQAVLGYNNQHIYALVVE